MSQEQIAVANTGKAPHLLYCWELGQGYGHVLNFRHLAQLMLDAGWQVSCLVSQPDTARALLPAAVVVAACPAIVRQKRFMPTRNLAEILHNNGFADEANCAERIDSWLAQIRQLQPDLMLLDYAPTALLAAELAGVKKVLLGTGFFIPPLQSPLPDLLESTDEASSAEAEVLALCNRRLSQAGRAELSSVSELFARVELQFLTTLPEFDHYPQRQHGDYWGPAFEFGQGVTPIWRGNGKMRIFVYLHRDYPQLAELLTELARLDADVLLHLAKVDASFMAAWPNLNWSSQPIRLDTVCQDADLVICHAGHGTIAGMLLAAKSMLLLPKQLEQLLLARQLCRQHLAYFLLREAPMSLLPELIAKIRQDQHLAAKLQQFKTMYQGFDRQEQTEGMRDALIELLSAR